jgi:eukaryotic-like serine/threonine-protein kinase
VTFPQQVVPRSPARSFVPEGTPNSHEPPAILEPTAASGSSPAQAQPPRDTQFEENLQLHIRSELPAASTSRPELPDYEILEVLGEGGMGIVFKARQRSLKRTVALKMVSGNRFSPGTRRRFQIEAETIARLHHPNIVQIYEVGEHEGRPYLALEYVEGGSLADFLAATGPLSVRQAVDLAAQLAQAMQYAHEKGVVHRDLKPANILLGSVGAVSGEWSGASVYQPSISTSQPKITDFGLAKLLDDDQSRTRSGAILGTPAYMAPEQARGQTQAVGPRADVYSLGAILYEMLTGQPPFFGHSSWELLSQVIHAEPQRPSRKRARLARDLDTICLKALTKDPGRRYASAGALAADLQRFSAGESIEARPERAWKHLAHGLRRHPILLACLLVVIGAVVLAGAFLGQQRYEARHALNQGRQFRDAGNCESALVSLQRGLEHVRSLPGCADLTRELEDEVWAVQREQMSTRLHLLAERMRFCHELDTLDANQASEWTKACREIWAARDKLLAPAESEAVSAQQERTLVDLHDVAMLGLLLERATAMSAAQRDQIHKDALAIIDELRSRKATLPILGLEKEYHARQLGATVPAEAHEPRNAWDHYLHGRSLLDAGEFARAGEQLQLAIQFDPSPPVFYYEAGICALKQERWDDARNEFTVCLALTRAGQRENRGHEQGAQFRDCNLQLCYFKRGIAEFHLQQWSEAEADLTAALQLNPKLGAAYFNRSLVYRKRSQMPEALADLHESLKLGFCPAQAHYQLALTYWDSGVLNQARFHLLEAQKRPDCPADAVRLEEELQKRARALNEVRP